MSQSINEQLSALIDSELSAAEEELLLKRLERDAGPRLTMTRYLMIGECLRGANLPANAAGLGERIRAAVEREPQHDEQSAPGLSAGRGLIAAGVAAAVALVAVMTLRPSTEAEVAVPAARVAASAVAPAAVSEPVSYTTPVGSLRRTAIPPARLTTYLVSHGEYANGLSRQVMDAYIVNNAADALSRETDQETRR